MTGTTDNDPESADESARPGERLRQRLRSVRDGMETNHAIRLHRAISWLRCAEDHEDDDEDLAFIALWIAFNSCYSVDDQRQASFREEFELFARKLVRLDMEEKIYNCLWFNFSNYVRLLIDNQWVYGPFWDSVRDGNDAWRQRFESSRKEAYRALANNRVAVLLSISMSRLYVLRNQLVHGGATWQGNLNREQVRDGKRMLLELVPVFIELMFDEEENWGQVFFPVVAADDPNPGLGSE